MFGLFKNKKPEKKPAPQFVDLNNIPLKEGDLVESLRYNLGKCKIEKDETGTLGYRSLESDKYVSWIRMIDASNDCQKVRKIVDQS
ncbi:MAG: hypothetical protein ACNS62_01525 [Candidatus Cyclobacteriaceae bacterium M3_2C_046]